jgi:hypothetical protein
MLQQVRKLCRIRNGCLSARQCLHVGSAGKHRKPLTFDGGGGFGVSGSGNNICGRHTRASTVIILSALW